jgi:Fic family protein|tara:strand:+ start:9782 stop:10744 length:963 start_codon:yes stop_codon:yes gene_type:complete
MNPPYKITTEILQLITSISEKIGQINAKFLDKPSPKLRKENRIKTIHSSLSIEGNTLTEEQITALIENKRIIGPEKDINEVLNAIRVYDQLNSFNPNSVKSFLGAHKILMTGLVADYGKFRKKGVGIMAGDKLAHMAPPAENVSHLMNDLFSYLKTSNEITLIKSCVFHYEMEFIHPFLDGNGRMGRLWQTIILMNEYPVFEFIPFENIIHKTQGEYYKSLSNSDKAGNSTPFIEYMLSVINDSLYNMLDFKSQIMSSQDRLNYFSEICESKFRRKDYMKVFTTLSTATASRDLKMGVEIGLFEKEGDKKNTIYRTIKQP